MRKKINGTRLAEYIESELGGRVHLRDFTAQGADPTSLIVRGPKDFDVFVNSGSSIQRQRLELAHELGHFALHTGRGKAAQRDRKLTYNRYDDKPEDKEADRFAIALLVPKGELEAQVESTNGNAVAIAKAFNVPIWLIVARCQALGLELQNID